LWQVGVAQYVQTFVQRSGGGGWCCVWASLVVAILICANAAWAQTNPFEAILTRNVFGLVPIPPAAKPPDPPLPKITLTGITTVTGVARALLKMAPLPGAAGAGGDRFFNLKLGERDGDLEVLEINEKSGTVVVAYTGRTLTLGFEAEKTNSPPPPILNPAHVSAVLESAPPPLPGASVAIAAEGGEDRAFIHEAIRADVQQRIQARIRLSKMGGAPLVSGQ
jgi:hypothetical protein